MNESAPEIIRPIPCPETWGVGIHTHDGHGLVMIQIATVTGVHVSYVAPQNALKIANDIKNAAREAARTNPGSKLIIPDGIPPNWNGKL